MYCKNCGNEMDAKAVICVKCGVPKGTDGGFCGNCGAPVQKNAVICTACGVAIKQEIAQQEEKKKSLSDKLKALIKKKRFWIGAVAVLTVLVIIIAAGGSGAPSDLIDLPESEYRAGCQSYTYEEIARNPDQYEKKLAVFTGEVVQVLRDGDELQMRVDVTYTGYLYTDTMYVFYNTAGGSNVIEGDIITMYGELRGMQEYETVLGAQMSIPRIYVKFIDIVK